MEINGTEYRINSKPFDGEPSDPCLEYFNPQDGWNSAADILCPDEYESVFNTFWEAAT